MRRAKIGVLPELTVTCTGRTQISAHLVHPKGQAITLSADHELQQLTQPIRQQLTPSAAIEEMDGRTLWIARKP